MAEHFQPPDPNYRQWATGAPLLEMHAITGAWAEFQALLAESPELAADVLAWVCPDYDPEYPAFEEAKRIATSMVASGQVE
jgi:hypothetical protein